MAIEEPEPEKLPPPPAEPLTAALAAIWNALSPLSPTARKRVLRAAHVLLVEEDPP